MKCNKISFSTCSTTYARAGLFPLPLHYDIALFDIYESFWPHWRTFLNGGWSKRHEWQLVFSKSVCSSPQSCGRHPAEYSRILLDYFPTLSSTLQRVESESASSRLGQWNFARIEHVFRAGIEVFVKFWREEGVIHLLRHVWAGIWHKPCGWSYQR